MYRLSSPFRIVSVLAVFVLVAGCASSRLEKRAFEGRRLAVTAAYPPEAKVLHPLLAASARYQPVGLRRDDQRALQRLQKTLRAAAETGDVSARLAGDLGAAASGALDATLADDPKAADYVLDFRVYDYGLVVRPDALVAHFYLEAEAFMRDRARDEIVWTQRLSRKGDVPVRLYEGRVTEAELAGALQDFLASASARLVKKLQDDVTTE